jgi:SAM-dependent methyltransferase
LVVAAVGPGVAACSRGSSSAASREPDVPYEPTPQHVVTQMLRLGEVGPNDVLYDLGCGDGRIVITAVKELGARGVCVDIDPQRIRESRENAQRAGVADRIQFLNQDLFETDIRDATVLTLFLWPEVNLRLRPKLFKELKPGTRVVSYMHDMGSWAPQQQIDVRVKARTWPMYLWRVPEPGSAP